MPLESIDTLLLSSLCKKNQTIKLNRKAAPGNIPEDGEVGRSIGKRLRVGGNGGPERLDNTF